MDKKILSFCIYLLISLPGVFAGDSDYKFTPIQLSWSWDTYLFDTENNTILTLGGMFEQKSAVLSLGYINIIERNYGISVGIANLTRKNYGLKFGIFNWSGIDIKAFQVLGINIAEAVQIGVVNDDAPVQIGVVNGSGKFQIGLWNYCPGSYLPHFPLINFDMGKKKESFNLSKSRQMP